MMLCFQNFPQLALNFSQVKSAVSYSYARVTSTSVTKKPEIDVYCSESFLNALKTFEQSENAKIFSSLPNNSFGPNLKDIQWVYKKDVNFKFKAKQSIGDFDLYISLNDSNRGYGSKQKKILDQYKKSTWGDSYVSKLSFNENKKSSYCASQDKKVQFKFTSPVFSSMSKTLNSYPADVISIQRRGFKTKRLARLEEKSNSEFYSRIKGIASEMESNKSLDAIRKKAMEIIKDESLTTSQKHDLKVTFAEGYIAGIETATSPLNKLKKFFKYSGMVILFVVIPLLLFYNGGRKYLMQFPHPGEVDAETIDVTFADVKGVEEAKMELSELVEFLRDPQKISSLGGKLPKGVLLVGPPGTGKTLLARAVAGEANVPFFHASGSEFDEIFVGEGARRVRNLFKSAKTKAPSIIFIDEIDCVGSKRKSTIMHPYANQTINQLLTEMDGFTKNDGVIVIGATNRKEDLDQALLRSGRFDVEVMVPAPDLNGRKDILELYLSKVVSKNVDVSKLAKSTYGCTGADLEAMVNHAAVKAAADGSPFVTMEYLEDAKDKIILGPVFSSKVSTEEENLMTAYHEGGHTVVAYFTEGAADIGKVTIMPRAKALGHTALLIDEPAHHTKMRIQAQMDVLMGGRAAEELIFGTSKITANASSDLERATEIASSMVKNFGMSEKIGIRTFKNSKGELVNVNEYGQVVTDQIDMEVKRLTQESYERAKTLLKKHAKEHKLLADALMKYKTLNPEEVKAILGDNSSEKGSASSSTV